MDGSSQLSTAARNCGHIATFCLRFSAGAGPRASKTAPSQKALLRKAQHPHDHGRPASASDCAGAYGNPKIRTPHLDRIAAEGVRFDSAYTSVPSCTPARTALLITSSVPGLMECWAIAIWPPGHTPVEKASAMAAAGYYTTSIGKNHYYPITNPHGYHHMISDEHCSYWFHQRRPGQPQS